MDISSWSMERQHVEEDIEILMHELSFLISGFMRILKYQWAMGRALNHRKRVCYLISSTVLQGSSIVVASQMRKRLRDHQASVYRSLEIAPIGLGGLT